jgi:hypothetical protein
MRWAVIIALMILVLSACKPVETQEIVQQPPAEPVVAEPEPAEPVVAAQEPVAPIVEQQPVAPPANATVSEESAVYERPPEEPPSIPKFLSQFKNEVRDYTFTYKSDAWAVQGVNARMKPMRVIENMYHAPYIDAIYFNLERKTAVGVCEGYNDQIKRQCAQRQILGQKFTVPFVQYKIILPEDWLRDLQNLYFTEADAPKLATTRTTVHLKHISQTRTIDIYIDPSSGLPLAVVDNGAEYHYDRLAKNQLGPTEKLSFE